MARGISHGHLGNRDDGVPNVASVFIAETRRAHLAGPQHIATSAGLPGTEGTTDGRDMNTITSRERRKGPAYIEASACSPGIAAEWN